MSANSKVSRTAAKKHVVVERTYRAKVEELWTLWTTKEGFESWWGPEGFRVEVHALEARVNGPLSYDMIADAPEAIEAMKKMGQPISHGVQARFTDLKRYERLAITSVIDFLPGVELYDSTIRVAFFPSGPMVRMLVTLDAMHSDEFTRMATEGFTSQLSKLDKRFART